MRRHHASPFFFLTSKMTVQDVVYLLTPAMFCYLLSARCPIRDAGATVAFRPPPWVFAVVWPVLFLLLGFAWMQAMRESNTLLTAALFLSITTSLALWISFYGCSGQKKAALWTLVGTLALLLIAFASFSSRAALAPMIAWIIFAMMMSTSEFGTA